MKKKQKQKNKNGKNHNHRKKNIEFIRIFSIKLCRSTTFWCILCLRLF